ncbi:MAG TPA: hypothetical protein VFN26_09995 [Candidatus Acidoferrum sp.]|nr:hypothetical protein [Candidatus Acidoferrum sp.]
MRLRAAAHPAASSYRVEVSGWDSLQTFFVEICELKWNEESGKLVTLTRSLRPGAMLFVRLLQPTSSDQSFPVPYRAELTGATADGENQFRLSQISPNIGLNRLSPR